MKRKKTHSPQQDRIAKAQKRLQEFHLPHGPFDYATQTQALAEARALLGSIVSACRTYHRDPAAELVIEAARRLYSAALDAAYPPGFWDDYERLRAGDASGLESAVSFLEADPIFRRTGYVKEKLIRYIKPHMLTPETASRLQNVVLSLVDRRDDRDFRAFCRLARKVDGPDLRAHLTQRLTHNDPNVQRRARWVLEAICQNN